MSNPSGVKMILAAFLAAGFIVASGNAEAAPQVPISHTRCQTFPVVARAQHRPMTGFRPPTFYEVRLVTVTVSHCPGHAFKLHVAREPWHLPSR